MIGANGVMNRVAEDGVLVDWFRKPHAKYGTTFRIIHVIGVLQIITIALSGGDVYLLGEAYAFGVVWSFFLKALGVLVLRYHRTDQEYKFPGNIRLAGVEIPIGLGATTVFLGAVAIANLFSKRVATIYGVLFTVSEHINRKKKAATPHGHPMEEFNLDMQPEVESSSLKARSGAILIAVRDTTNLLHLRSVLQKTNMRRHDIVVMTVRQISTGAGEYQLGDNQLFTSYEQELFSKVVEMAEKEGKTVEVLCVPANDPFDAIVQTASKMKASRVVTGASQRMESEELARRIGLAWERLDEPRHPFSLEVIAPGRPSFFVNLGPHPPRLWPEDLDRLHGLWLRLSEGEFGSRLHHRDVLGVALQRLERDLENEARKPEAMTDIESELRQH